MDYTERAQACVALMNGMRRLMKSFYYQEELKGEDFLLMFLVKMGGHATPGEISQAMQVTTPRITALLNALEEKGHVHRTHSMSDRRRAQVEITSSGREHVRLTQEGIVDRTAAVLEYLGEHDSEELIRIMDRLAQFTPDPPLSDRKEK